MFFTKEQRGDILWIDSPFTWDCVEMRKGLYKGKLGELIDYLLENDLRDEGKMYKVLLLSHPDAPETIRLDEPIINDLVAANGRPTAFTQNQRYVELDVVRRAHKTSELC